MHPNEGLLHHHKMTDMQREKILTKAAFTQMDARLGMTNKEIQNDALSDHQCSGQKRMRRKHTAKFKTEHKHPHPASIHLLPDQTTEITGKQMDRQKTRNHMQTDNTIPHQQQQSSDGNSGTTCQCAKEIKSVTATSKHQTRKGQGYLLPKWVREKHKIQDVTMHQPTYR